MAVGILEIRDELKGSGTTRLRDLVLDGYTRTLASDGLARVNPFEVEDGRAPDPDDPGPPYLLTPWENYSHEAFNRGDDLRVTVGRNKLTVEWSLPAGYNRDPDNLTQYVYYKSMGTTQDLNTDPFVSPDGSPNVGDVTSYELTAVEGEWYAIGVIQEWDDSDELLSPATSFAYIAHEDATELDTSASGISTDSAVFEDVPDEPGIQQLTDSEDCSFGCTDCVDMRISWTHDGGPGSMTVEYSLDEGSSWTPITETATSSGFSDIVVDGDDEVWARAKYNDVSPESWSATNERVVQCDQI